MKRRASGGYALMLFIVIVSGLSLWIAAMAQGHHARLRAARAAADEAQLHALARGGLELGLAPTSTSALSAYKIDGAILTVEAFEEAPRHLLSCAQRAERRVCLEAHAQGGQLLRIWSASR